MSPSNLVQFGPHSPRTSHDEVAPLKTGQRQHAKSSITLPQIAQFLSNLVYIYIFIKGKCQRSGSQHVNVI